jgi:hypothetical protein
MLPSVETPLLSTEAPAGDAGETDLRAVGDYRLIAMLVGAVAAGVTAWLSPDRTGPKDGHTRWVIFAMVAVVLGAVAGEAFGFGIARFRELQAIARHRLVALAPMIVGVVVLTVAVLVLAPQVIGESTVTIRGWALTLLAVLGALPTAAALAAIQRLARKPLPGSVGAQLSLLMHVRRTLSRLLNQLGLLVILLMAVNGAAWLDDKGNNAAIFAGAVGSLVVGVMYVPAATTLRRRAATFVARNFSIADVPREQLVEAAESQGKLEKLLGLDQTTFGEMKAGLVILTPFVASALATFVRF